MAPCNHPHQQPAPSGDITVGIPAETTVRWHNDSSYVRLPGVTLTLSLADATALYIDLAKQINTLSANSAMTTEGDQHCG